MFGKLVQCVGLGWIFISSFPGNATARQWRRENWHNPTGIKRTGTNTREVTPTNLEKLYKNMIRNKLSTRKIISISLQEKAASCNIYCIIVDDHSNWRCQVFEVRKESNLLNIYIVILKSVYLFRNKVNNYCTVSLELW